MDIMTTLQLVLKKSLAHGGLARGLNEGAKVIEKHATQLCVVVEDCNQPDYVKLVKALFVYNNVSLITVPAAKTLGEWAGGVVNSVTCLPGRGVAKISYIKFLQILTVMTRYIKIEYYVFSSMVVRKPAHHFLDELEIEYDEKDTYVVIKHAALFTSTIMSRL